MSIGNLTFGVNSVTISYLIRYNSLLQKATQNATAILLQNATEVYYKSCQVFFLLQNVTVLLQNATTLLQNTTVIIKYDVY